MLKGKYLLIFLFALSLNVQAQLSDSTDRNKKANLDKEFLTGSKIVLDQPSTFQISDLEVLAKVWGFLKYHHPAIAKGDYNWDFELFRITPQMLAVKNLKERDKLIFKWIDALGPFENGRAIRPAKEQIKYELNFDWFKSSKFSPELLSQLNAIKNADRTTESYYVKMYDAETPVAIFKNEGDYSSFKYPDAGYRLLGLFKFWNSYEYFSPYRNLLDKPWSGILKEYIPKLIAAKNELDYKLTIAALIAETQDSHSDISPYDMAFRSFYGTLTPKVTIAFVDNQAVVTNSTEEGSLNALKKGDVIQSINNVPVSKLMKEKLPYVSASNYATQLRKLTTILLRTNDTLMQVSFIRDDKPEQLSLKCYPFNRREKQAAPIDSGFKMINKDIAYIHASRIETRLKSVMPMAMQTKAMILDLRTYPKPTSFAWDLAKYIFNAPKEVARYTAGSTEIPGLFSYMPDDYMAQVRIGVANESPYLGKIIVLVNEETQSLGELSAMALRAGPNTIIVGSQTAGADGSVGMPVTFPGGIATGFTQIGVYYPDGKETQRIGIIPDVKVKPSVKGIKEGRDEILEKAISLLN